MNSLDMTTYFLTLIAISISPGPIVMMLVVRAAGNDLRGALNFGFGYALGGVIIVTAVCFGLSAWFTAVPELFDYSKYVLMAYILYLARGIWISGFDLDGESCDTRKGSLSSIGAGIATCAISPYMMMLFPLVLPGMMDISQITMPSFLIVALITLVSLCAGAGLVIGFAAQLRRIASTPQRAKHLNRGLAALLVLGGGTMAFA